MNLQTQIKEMPDRLDAKQADNPFDEAYFKGETGSAYGSNNYLETALLSRTYFEMAELIATCFQPARVLEIGCGAGPVVFHLNQYFDTEAHGLDISRWAVENRLHENVQQGSADQIPFEDNSFDLVFSCHALEHLNRDILPAAIGELSRVCSPDGVQVHMLPILGEGPYTDVFGSIVGLRADPTHNLLHRRDWWTSHWERLAWHDSHVRVALAYDNPSFEFSDCQFVLSRSTATAPFHAAVARWNLDVARTLQRTLTRRPAPGLEVFLADIKANWPA